MTSFEIKKTTYMKELKLKLLVFVIENLGKKHCSPFFAILRINLINLFNIQW